MLDIRTHHQLDLPHHISQGVAWLSASNNGENTAALSYAAFELRFAVERLAIHYLRVLVDQKLGEQDLHDIKSFKRVERRIYAVAGHQAKIDGHVAFMRVINSALKIDTQLHSPQITSLSKYWDEYSDLCHISWVLSCKLPEVQATSFSKLTEIAEMLTVYVKSIEQSFGWSFLKEATFAELRDRFVSGDATEDDVVAYLKRIGIWAKVEYPDGRPSHFIGEPVPIEASGNQ